MLVVVRVRSANIDDVNVCVMEQVGVTTIGFGRRWSAYVVQEFLGSLSRVLGCSCGDLMFDVGDIAGAWVE